MTTICQETLNVDSVVCFGDIKDVLKNSCKREKSVGGTINFTTINGSQFVTGKYNIFYINKHTVIMCLDGVDPSKIHEYMLSTDCSDFRDPHLINRYDWKRTIYGCDSKPFQMKCDLARDGIEVKTGVLRKIRDTLGENYYYWTYVIKGNANLNSITKDELSLTKIESQSEDAPKGFYVMKNTQDGTVIGFICKITLQGDHEYGALLEDPALGHFAFINSDEHIYNSYSKTREELQKCLPNKFKGLVNIKDFLKP